MKKAILAATVLALLICALAWGGSHPVVGGGGSSTFDPSTNTSPVQAQSYSSTGADNTHYLNVRNTASPTGANLSGGNVWTLTDNSVMYRSGDNVATFADHPAKRSFSFVIKSASTADNVLLWRVPNDIQLKGVVGYASVDNVSGRLWYSAVDNVASLTATVAAPVTYTNAAAGVATALDNAVSAGSWLRWTTSAIGAATNVLTVTVEYYER